MPSFKEIEVIEALQESTMVAPENVILGIGDDAPGTKIDPG